MERPARHAASRTARAPAGRLALVLGDQLDHESEVLRTLDPSRDTVLLAEVRAESTHVPSHRQRTILFLSAMRHFAQELRARGIRVRYVELDDPQNTHSLAGELSRAVRELLPASVTLVEPGEHRVKADLSRAAAELGISLTTLEDRHFLTSDAEFSAWAEGRASLTMEYFYRAQRRRLGILVDEKGRPESGRWNFDADNREAFGSSGSSPGPPPPRRFEPDPTTRAVIALVDRELPRAPGRSEPFGWPVTRSQALMALDDFTANRLALFGKYEDAMWTGEPTLYHSLLAPALNLKLLNPRECVDAAVRAYCNGAAPLQSVEAFIRQIIGWREFIRGVYRREGPAYGDRNGLHQHGALPAFYWSGDTELNCLRHAINQVVDTGFGHHIQRLMVTGNFALTAGVHPRAVSDWYLAMFVDAVDWVTLPNALGMVMHADGTDTSPPVVGTKPYAASGQYIARMSNYCRGCRYRPEERTGDRACPFTVFYWDFLNRHRARFSRNPRMAQIVRNLDRFGPAQVQEITVSARRLRDRFGIGDIHAPRPQRPAGDTPDYSPPPAPHAPLFQRPEDAA